MTGGFSDRNTTGSEATEPDGEIPHPLPGKRTISRPIAAFSGPALLVPDPGFEASKGYTSHGKVAQQDSWQP